MVRLETRRISDGRQLERFERKACITREQKRPGSDDLEIKDMKKRKLVIKEDILLLEDRGAPA
ncbi:DUF465 domain-containing protein [Octadecabacter arcticus]|uniref:DUF465 domain-containing protein n=1 Tax=Octadecabacter arcticus TaxID=53946 RepID=UPI0009FFDD13